MTDCRYCGFEGAYDSGFSVECASPECKYFSQEQCKQWVTAEIRRRLVQSFMGPTPGPFPSPFTATNPTPTSIAVEASPPSDSVTYVWTFELDEDAPPSTPKTDPISPRAKERAEEYKLLVYRNGFL